MNQGSVVIVGGGQAGFQAAASLRDRGFDGPLALVSEEGLPYQRPPLSKACLKARLDQAELLLRPESFYKARGIAVEAGVRATRIDRGTRQVVLSSGAAIGYRSVVLATGARPRRLNLPGGELGNVLTLRTAGDADRVRTRLERASHVVIIGGGVLGFEVAAAARERGADVAVVESLPVAMGRALSAETSSHVVQEHRRRGVRVLLGRGVTGLDGDSADQVRALRLDDGSHLAADVVVVCIGVEPSVDLAVMSGLPVAGGIVVDHCLRTADPDIYAIGDCAVLHDRHGSRAVRLESVHSAVSQGKHVASVILGGTDPYGQVPYFWTDQYDLRVQAAGSSAGHDAVDVGGDPATGRFSVEFFRHGALLGVESVNSPADHMRARRLLQGGSQPSARHG